MRRKEIANWEIKRKDIENWEIEKNIYWNWRNCEEKNWKETKLKIEKFIRNEYENWAIENKVK